VTRWRALFLLAAAELAGMSLWFGASAAAPALAQRWGLAAADAGHLTLAVQLGFVVGTLVSAVSNLSDVHPPRYVFAVSALLAALANAVFALASAGVVLGLALRFATGFCLAGVYPPGMKMMASWFREGRGLALGILIGALTLGKASPYLVNAIGSADWRVNLVALSIFAIAGGAIALVVGDGPFATGTAPFDVHQVLNVFRNRGVRLASFGYFGHMWELYAMWTWIPVMIRASLDATGEPHRLAEVASFVVIGAGAAGCVAAGSAADRWGRTAVASAAMAVSGACCVAVGFFFGGSATALLAIAAIWGATVVADSAQFSACVTELADPRYLGTALTLQICLGFLLTTASIALVGRLQHAVGWRWAFASLAPGPALGVVAMLRLRSLPEAARIAQGRR
jgi:MFS family permease